jgi:hypothetical protein
MPRIYKGSQRIIGSDAIAIREPRMGGSTLLSCLVNATSATTRDSVLSVLDCEDYACFGLVLQSPLTWLMVVDTLPHTSSIIVRPLVVVANHFSSSV